MRINNDIYDIISCSSNVLLFSKTMPDINYIARTATVGKEFEMVVRYIKFLTNKYKKLKNKHVAIFVEPQLDTGYPDIVLVEYNSIPKLEWSPHRKNLHATDIKILFYVQRHGYCSVYDLHKKLGFSIETIKKTVLKLKKCGLVYLYSDDNCVRPVALKSYCRISKIISIEAKLDKWNEAIRQAANNVWFATESYVLMNKASCSNSIQAACQANGVGIILVNGTMRTVLSSDKRQFPVSYASLQFNEWILRYINTRR